MLHPLPFRTFGEIAALGLELKVHCSRCSREVTLFAIEGQAELDEVQQAMAGAEAARPRPDDARAAIEAYEKAIAGPSGPPLPEFKHAD